MKRLVCPSTFLCLYFNLRSTITLAYIPLQPSETERLLYTSPPQPTYGASAQRGSVPATEIDPEDLRRQREALERICAETSDSLIDVMHHTPLTNGNKFTDGYGELFKKAFARTAIQVGDEDEEEAWADVLKNVQSLVEVKGANTQLVIQLADPSAASALTKKPVK